MENSPILVLGAGMVGSAMAIDLAAAHPVLLTDVSPLSLDKAKVRCPSLNTRVLDVRDTAALHALAEKSRLVLCAVPGFLGFETVRQLILAGKDVVDISFFPENCLDLDDLAKKKGVTAIVDCGVAPGMGNLILGRYNETWKLQRFECLVGGLPKVRKWPFSYKAPFSPADVIEEYTRPARYVENGRMVVREPLTDCELIDFDQAGTLEAFNSDGLRSLIFTMPHIPDMKEKTLRYPGHVEYIRVLRESGFFGTEPIPVGPSQITPLDFTSRILFSEWKLGEEEEEFTVMRITLEGLNEKGQSARAVWNLYDEYDPATKTSSMARTTGYTATAAVNMMLNGLFREKGVFPPERVGSHPACFQSILEYLKERKVVYSVNENLIKY